jgi:predicted enzyme related to lactoylglutathione lyase
MKLEPNCRELPTLVNVNRRERATPSRPVGRPGRIPSMATSGPRIGLFLTELLVDDWAGTVRWYVETLRLRLALEDRAGLYALLESGSGSGRLALKGGGIPGPSRDRVRLVFEVDDVDAERERLLCSGLDVGVPTDSPEGYRAITLLDPERTPLTLFCWKASGPEVV